MRLFRTIALSLLAIISITAAVFVTIDGNLSAIIGYSAFKKGERLFPYTHEQMARVNWMRVQNIHETAEFEQKDDGVWWMISPWNDRMDPLAAAAILQYTYSTTIIDALPINNTVKASMREFGVETNPVNITLKRIKKDGATTSMARYTLGSTAPWLSYDPENKTKSETTYMKSDFYGRSNRILVGTGNILPLFKENINQLRDHRPFLLPPSISPSPSQPCEILIHHKKQTIKLIRDSLTTPWQIVLPLPVPGDQKKIRSLADSLQQLTAVKVYDYAEGILPDLPESELTTIEVKTFANQTEPVKLTIYPQVSSKSSTALATISNRNAIFELPIQPVKVDENVYMPGTNSLSLNLSSIRSPYLMEIDRSKLRGISIRSSAEPFPLIVRLMEGDQSRNIAAKEVLSPEGELVAVEQGDKNQSVSSKWLYSAEGGKYSDINEEQLFDLLKAFVSYPVENFVSDSPGDLSIYGLNSPLYTITLSYEDKDKQAPLQVLFIGKGIDGAWYAMENGKPSVYQVSQKFMSTIKVDNLSWQPKKLFHFPRLYLKQMSLARKDQPALILNYDYLEESWTAFTQGKEVTDQINSNRARHYLNALETIRVWQWLPSSDGQAAKALENPLFTLQLTLEVPVQEQKNLAIIPSDGSGFTELHIPDEETRKETIILDIAPVGRAGRTNYYYGKINTSPYFMLLDMDAVRILGASVYER